MSNRDTLREAIAEAIDKIDHESRPPEGYANGINNEWISDWGLWIADGVLMAMAEAGFNVVFDPVEAVKDMKTYPHPVRRANGIVD